LETVASALEPDRPHLAECVAVVLASGAYDNGHLSLVDAHKRVGVSSDRPEMAGDSHASHAVDNDLALRGI